jgi:hypothetical protein
MPTQHILDDVALEQKRATLMSIQIDEKNSSTRWLKQKLSRRNLKISQKSTPSEEKESERLKYNNGVETLRRYQYPMLNGENPVATDKDHIRH